MKECRNEKQTCLDYLYHFVKSRPRYSKELVKQVKLKTSREDFLFSFLLLSRLFQHRPISRWGDNQETLEKKHLAHPQAEYVASVRLKPTPDTAVR